MISINLAELQLLLVAARVLEVTPKAHVTPELPMHPETVDLCEKPLEGLAQRDWHCDPVLVAAALGRQPSAISLRDDC